MPRKPAAAGVTAAGRVSISRAAAAPAAVVINPATNDLTLNPTDILDESITVTMPKGRKCKNLKLVPSPSVAPFVDSIDPPGGYGPITGERDETLSFRVRFHGLPCTAEPQIFTG